MCSKESFYGVEQSLSQAERDENHHERVDAVDENAAHQEIPFSLSMRGCTTVTVTPHSISSHSLYSRMSWRMKFFSSSSSVRYEYSINEQQLGHCMALARIEAKGELELFGSEPDAEVERELDALQMGDSTLATVRLQADDLPAHDVGCVFGVLVVSRAAAERAHDGYSIVIPYSVYAHENSLCTGTENAPPDRRVILQELSPSCISRHTLRCSSIRRILSLSCRPI